MQQKITGSICSAFLTPSPNFRRKAIGLSTATLLPQRSEGTLGPAFPIPPPSTEVKYSEPRTSPTSVKRSVIEVLKKKKYRGGGKRKLVTISEQFTIQNQGEKKLALCVHCTKIVQGPVVKINVTRLRSHLLACSKIPESKRRESFSCSQKAMKLARLRSLTPSNSRAKSRELTSCTINSESIEDLRKMKTELHISESRQVNKKTSVNRQYTMKSYGVH